MVRKNRKQQNEVYAFWAKYGLDPVKMERFEKGKQLLTTEDVVEICRKTGMSADYLLLGKKPDPPRIKILSGEGNA